MSGAQQFLRNLTNTMVVSFCAGYLLERNRPLLRETISGHQLTTGTPKPGDAVIRIRLKI
jgi:hypothetical protein